jgi:hypothetical protein
LPEEENMMLLVATVGWSWAEQVNEETILDREENYTEQVLEAMRHRYEKRNGNNDEGKGNSDSVYSSPNKQLESQQSL